MSVKKIKTDPIKTVLVITVGMIILHVAYEWHWALYVGLGIGIFGLASDYLAKKIDYLWLQLTKLLSLIIPNILLSAVFYVILTPVAFLSRLFGDNNPLSLKDNKASLFRDSNKTFEKNSFEKPW